MGRPANGFGFARSASHNRCFTPGPGGHFSGPLPTRQRNKLKSASHRLAHRPRAPGRQGFAARDLLIDLASGKRCKEAEADPARLRPDDGGLGGDGPTLKDRRSADIEFGGRFQHRSAGSDIRQPCSEVLACGCDRGGYGNWYSRPQSFVGFLADTGTNATRHTRPYAYLSARMRKTGGNRTRASFHLACRPLTLVKGSIRSGCLKLRPRPRSPALRFRTARNSVTTGASIVRKGAECAQSGDLGSSWPHNPLLGGGSNLGRSTVAVEREGRAMLYPRPCRRGRRKGPCQTPNCRGRRVVFSWAHRLRSSRHRSQEKRGSCFRPHAQDARNDGYRGCVRCPVQKARRRSRAARSQLRPLGRLEAPAPAPSHKSGPTRHPPGVRHGRRGHRPDEPLGKDRRPAGSHVPPATGAAAPGCRKSGETGDRSIEAEGRASACGLRLKICCRQPG